VSEVRFYVVPAAPHRRDYDDFPLLHTRVRIFLIGKFLSHLALILLNAGHLHPAHRTIGQRPSYLEDLAVVGSDDPDFVRDCRIAETQGSELESTVLTYTEPMELFHISLDLQDFIDVKE